MYSPHGKAKKAISGGLVRQSFFLRAQEPVTDARGFAVLTLANIAVETSGKAAIINSKGLVGTPDHPHPYPTLFTPLTPLTPNAFSVT